MSLSSKKVLSILW